MRKASKTEYGYDSAFPKKLRDIMDATKTTQEVLAKKCNVSRQSVAQWRDGNTRPDILSLRTIAEYFGVSTDYLLGLETGTTHDTDALMNSLGLSETAIDILSKNEKSPLVVDIKEMLDKVPEETQKEEATTNVINSVTEDIRSTINRLIEDCVVYNCWCKDSHLKTEKPILYLLDDFYKALESPEEKFLLKDNGFDEIEPLGNKIRLVWHNENGTFGGYEEIRIKEYMANTSIAEISTRLHNIKHRALKEEENAGES